MNLNLRRTLSLLVALVATAAFAQQNQGRWNAQFRPDKTVQLELREDLGPHNFSNRSVELPLARLANLNFTPGQASTTAHFEIKAEAGIISFEGVVSGDTGAGKYSFTADPQFNRAMDQLGLFVDPDQQLSWALNNVTVAYAKSVRGATNGAEGESVLKMAKLGVDLTYVQQMTQVFGQKLWAEDVIALAKHDVTAEFVQKISQAYGKALSVDEVSTAAKHELTPEYVTEVRRLLPNTEFDDIDSLHKREVTPQFITAAQKCHLGITSDEIEHLKKKFGSPCASLE